METANIFTRENKVQTAKSSISILSARACVNIETRFINNMGSSDLLQQNHQPNSRGTLLDLVFSNTHISNLEKLDDYRLLDQNSTHHHAITFIINFNGDTNKIPAISEFE